MAPPSIRHSVRIQVYLVFTHQILLFQVCCHDVCCFLFAHSNLLKSRCDPLNNFFHGGFVLSHASSEVAADRESPDNMPLAANAANSGEELEALRVTDMEEGPELGTFVHISDFL